MSFETQRYRLETSYSAMPLDFLTGYLAIARVLLGA